MVLTTYNFLSAFFFNDSLISFSHKDSSCDKCKTADNFSFTSTVYKIKFHKHFKIMAAENLFIIIPFIREVSQRDILTIEKLSKAKTHSANTLHYTQYS